MFFRRAAGFVMIPLCCLLLLACSGGSGDDTPDPANGSDWGKMEWDKGEWS